MVRFFGDYFHEKKVAVTKESEKNGCTPQNDEMNLILFKGNLTDNMKIKILKNREVTEQICNKENACNFVRYAGFTVYVMSVLYIMYYVLDLAFGKKDY